MRSDCEDGSQFGWKEISEVRDRLWTGLLEGPYSRVAENPKKGKKCYKDVTLLSHLFKRYFSNKSNFQHLWR